MIYWTVTVNTVQISVWTGAVDFKGPWHDVYITRLKSL